MNYFKLYTSIIPRIRSIFDKYMGILILLYHPERYKDFIHANSRKKIFKTIMLDTDRVSNSYIESLDELIAYFDENFRTPEVHNIGKVRKWCFSIDSFGDTPALSIMHYWNQFIESFSTFDKIMESVTIIDDE